MSEEPGKYEVYPKPVTIRLEFPWAMWWGIGSAILISLACLTVVLVSSKKVSNHESVLRQHSQVLQAFIEASNRQRPQGGPPAGIPTPPQTE